ncbi:hypothetical protein P3T23_009278 [Paraburkholderia sp. GAS448]|uniref:type 4 pilus major pilin n=1 Tax=Paraburkholderia sp. GAS448 TaxID=3035136 RepID=UPI003D252905
MDEIMGTLFKYMVRLLGIGLIVVVLMTIFHKNKAQAEASNLIQLETSIANTYNGQTLFSSLTEAIAANLAPAGMVSGATLINQWGGAVTVTVDANASQFDIVENSVPKDGCSDLATKVSNYVSMTLGGSTFTPSSPLDAGQATTLCSAAATTNISFVFGH